MSKSISYIFTLIFTLLFLMFIDEFQAYQSQYNLASTYTNQIALVLQKYGYDYEYIKNLKQTKYFDEYEIYEQNEENIVCYTIVTLKNYNYKYQIYSFMFSNINYSITISKVY